MKEMKRILVVLVAILMVSSVLYADPAHVNNANNPTSDNVSNGKGAPQTEGAVWGAEGAVWGGNSLEPGAQNGNPSDQGAYHQSLVDLIKALGRGLGFLLDGAVWG